MIRKHCYYVITVLSAKPTTALATGLDKSRLVHIGCAELHILLCEKES